MSVRHPVFARVYSSVVARVGRRLGLDELRRRLVAGLSGEVLEVGVGPGDSFAFYPTGVTRLVAVEPEPYLRRRAEAAARTAPVPVEVRADEADALDLPDDSVDAVVFSLVLCSVPDQHAALAEAARVLRPGGELRLLEHVRAHEPGLGRRLQPVLDATVWPRLFGGCHCGRDTVAAVRRAGFDTAGLQAFHFPEGARGVEASSIIGSAPRAESPR